MKQRFERMAKHLQHGESLLLLTVLHTEGSVPRQAGTQMLLFPDGTTEGTVGGGEMERSATARGKQLLQIGASATERFSLPHGSVLVAMQFLRGGDLRLSMLFEDAAALCDGEENGWLICNIAESGSRIEPALCNGSWIAFSREIIMDEVRPLLWKKTVYVDGAPAWFCLPLARAARSFVFGAGHVAQKLVPLLASMDLSVTVIDPRTDLCNTALFPLAAACIPATPEQALTRICLGEHDIVIAMGSDAEADYEVLVHALRSDAAYVGCIGSHQKIVCLKERLLAAGIAADRIAALHAPIGMEIGAQTPAEIAVSIAAEIISFRSVGRESQS